MRSNNVVEVVDSRQFFLLTAAGFESGMHARTNSSNLSLGARAPKLHESTGWQADADMLRNITAVMDLDDDQL